MAFTKITLKQVALKAGVSPTTVSSALRARGRMTPELRQKICTLSKEMGYQIDPILSAAMSQLRKKPERRIESVLAWFDMTPARDSLKDNLAHQAVWSEACRQASEMGYRIERFWFHDPDLSPARLGRILRARGIKGILIRQYHQKWDPRPALPMKFDFSDFACVKVSNSFGNPHINFVQADHFACADLALSNLRELGYHRVGLVCPPSIDTLTSRRIYSAYEGFVCHNPEMTRIPTFVDESEQEKKALRMWIRKHKPDAVLSWILPDEFRAMGFTVPETLGVCMLDVFPEFRDCAGVCQNHREIGAAAVRKLCAQLQQGLWGIPSVVTATMIEGRWIHGASLPPKAKNHCHPTSTSSSWQGRGPAFGGASTHLESNTGNSGGL